MVIEIADILLDFMREMPEQKELKSNSAAGSRKNILDWISRSLRNGTAPCGIQVGFLYEIMRTAIQKGFIRYDPETHTWQGVDYEAD